MDKQVGGFKKGWQDSGLSPRKMTGAALAAITMSLIAPRITSWTDSIAAVGIISILTATMGALYTGLVTATTTRAHQVAAPLLGEPTQNGNNTTPPPKEEEPEPAETKPATTNRKRLRAAIVYPTMFALISLITISASYFASGEASEIDFHVTQTQSLSEEEKQDIISEATEQAQSETPAPEKTVIIEQSGGTGEPHDDHEDIEKRLTEIEEENVLTPETLEERLDNIEDAIQWAPDSLEQRITDLEKENQQLTKQIRKQPADNTTQIKTLEKEISDLKELVQDLQEQITRLEKEATEHRGAEES